MKIFGIGMGRTGTLSLNAALRTLGYSSVHFPCTFQDIKNNDAATDVGFILEHLDRTYQNSKFIYTIRAVDEWITSMLALEKHINDNDIHQKLHPGMMAGLLEMNGWLKWFDLKDEERLSLAFTSHDRRVTDYFRNRRNRLLTLNVACGWEPLCKFLNKPIPEDPFPHLNKTGKYEVF